MDGHVDDLDGRAGGEGHGRRREGDVVTVGAVADPSWVSTSTVTGVVRTRSSDSTKCIVDVAGIALGDGRQRRRHDGHGGQGRVVVVDPALDVALVPPPPKSAPDGLVRAR